MTRTDKTFLSIISAVALSCIVLLVIFLSPRDLAIRNQIKLVRLLARAEPQFTAADSSRIERITLGDSVKLVPECDQVAVGYVLKAHVQSSTFTIEAHPMKVGTTGLFSYFRDETGVVRFEMGGNRANAGSRPVEQSLPD